MELTHISTARFYRNEYFFEIVFEWEEAYAKALNVPFFKEKSIINKKWARVIPGLLYFATPHQPTFAFELNALTKFRPYNNKNVIPNIIDFFLPESQIEQMLNAYKKNPVVLLSSKEAFDYLQQKKDEYHVNINLQHLGLSLSDKYRLTPDKKFEKKYDLVSMGRTNPVLLSFLKQYAAAHPDFTYVICHNENGKYIYYMNEETCIGSLDTRADFFNMMRAGRIGLYATPGIDGGEKRTNGFSQVTPRLLEYLASGCHVIARYKKNSDTDFYEMDDMCPSVNSYDEFEKQIDFALTHEVDMNKSCKYLEKHYTSTRAKQLIEILKGL